MSNGEGQRKEVYYKAQAALGKGKVAFQPIFSHLPPLGGRVGVGREVCIIIKHSQ
jgi:hypothetical protein